MAKMVLDEYGFLEEPCLSCDKAYTDDLFYEWCCDEKECPYMAQNEVRGMTNADRIRNMSNYELAEFIYNVSNGATKISTCEEKCAECEHSDDYCIYQIGEWLTSESDK